MLFSISVEESTPTTQRAKGEPKTSKNKWIERCWSGIAPPKKKTEKNLHSVWQHPQQALLVNAWTDLNYNSLMDGTFLRFSSFFTQDPSKYCKHLQAIYTAIEWLVPVKCAKDQLATSLPNGASPSVCNSCTHRGMWNHVEAVCQYAHAGKSWDPAFFHRQCRACQFFKELSIALQGQWYFELMTSLTMRSFIPLGITQMGSGEPFCSTEWCVPISSEQNGFAWRHPCLQNGGPTLCQP